jgi:hypothetical protein
MIDGARASIVEILDYIDPTALPPEIQQTIQVIGPLLVSGLTMTEIASRLGRKKDWTRDRLRDIRRALLAQAVDHIDDMNPALRHRVEQEIAALPPVRRPRRFVTVDADRLR